jgi:hypothetical protein
MKSGVLSYYPTFDFLWCIITLICMHHGSSVNLLAIGIIMFSFPGGDGDISICYVVACDGGSPNLLSDTGIFYTSK